MTRVQFKHYHHHHHHPD
ncbi:his operon leader peptide [Salmonella enterica]|uniref:his operon leader peptide n=2 Tax=Salmonella houtenae TaxID=59205 RepID=A0A5Y6MDN8_SALHO|nr:his operon leader peptide [Salmonella enterica subsp. enterica]EAW0939403.1 his operon leader peptide [Salmonella enterica]EBF8289875.1 his operon leader peptide [Salmonella enterica subsp. houtenae]EBQ5984540.1 his operon leader peptide [Salmonella enterica subsp. houtenae serovar Houten]EDS4969596.1 his operon leader peptide [Salmonella enterica subsp. enterica serovar O rough]EHA4053703.1 his operon leader peptide [Salmonella enterica subsp. enterica serovar Farmingdale]